MPKEAKRRKTWEEVQLERQMKQRPTEEVHRKQTESNNKRKRHKLSKGKMLFAIGLAALLIITSAYGIWQSSEGDVNPSLIGPAPNFSLKDINGTQVSLNQFKGKVVVIHFMALAGCSGQIYEINDNQLRQLGTVCSKYCGKGQVAIVTVSVASCQGCDTVLAQIRDYYGISWILGNDYDDQKLDIVQSYADALRASALYDGTVVLIDKASNVAQVYNSTITADLLSAKIDQLLQAA
ncbi:redoxin domain-containing protein [Candidatus Bathyarchaeota archaeon]|nr:redoxin domain-containing protein [Candidatus Bathyarchaeota archaeon]